MPLVPRRRSRNGATDVLGRTLAMQLLQLVDSEGLMDRRRFMIGLGGSLAAPAVVRAASLMPIFARFEPDPCPQLNYSRYVVSAISDTRAALVTTGVHVLDGKPYAIACAPWDRYRDYRIYDRLTKMSWAARLDQERQREDANGILLV